MSTNQSTKPLVPPTVVAGGVQLEAWGEQQNFWTERVRGGALVWPKGSSWFVNDPLGPLPHSHPDASEIYFVAKGVLDVEIGGRALQLSEGDFCLIPPNTFHDPRGTAGTSLGLFCVVAPNWRGRRWQTEEPAAAELEPLLLWNAGSEAPPPSDGLLVTKRLSLAPGEGEEHAIVRGRERVVYVLSGRLSITIDNLCGDFEAHQYVHVPSNARHRLESTGSEPLVCLSVWALDPAAELEAESAGSAKA
jgi:mannose-6-phosphate isomerase-like protein (cupin superfamily)